MTIRSRGGGLTGPMLLRTVLLRHLPRDLLARGHPRLLIAAMEPRTYRDAGRERALGAAGRSTRQAGASTSRRHWLWTRMESRASSGLEEKYDLGTVTRMSDRRSTRHL